MKNNENLKVSIGMSVILLLLFFSGCKKNLADPESDYREIKEVSTLSFTVKSDTIPRISKELSLRTLEKMKAVLEKKVSKINKVSDYYFTATPWGPHIYYCVAEVNMSGPIDWYLVDEATWTYSHVASSSGSNMEYYFNCTTPGYYRLWAVNSEEDFYTESLYFD